MSIIKKFNLFLLREMTEFNAQRFNSDSGGMAIHVDNPQLSVNAFDKHEDAIRAASVKINGIMRSLSNSPQFASLKSKLSLSDQNIDSLKIIRISKLNTVDYTAYISFIINDHEYWGVIENILSDDPIFKSEVFKDNTLVLTKEWIIKIKGLIIKVLKRWLKPEDGNYKLINSNAFCLDVNSGELIELLYGSEVEVIKSFDNKIIINYDNNIYSLSGDNYVYFNYWFLKLF